MRDALRNGKFAAALKKLGLDKGSGSDGSLPNATRQVQFRMIRQAGEDGQGCKDIEAEWKNFNTTGDKAVQGVQGEVDDKEVNNTIDSLDKLNNR